MPPGRLDRSLQLYFDRRTAAGEPPGAAWCVGVAGENRSRGFSGTASRETVFDLASLTKPLSTALLAAILEQDGLLDLDAPLSEPFPPSGASPYGTATLLDLGAHRAGLPAWEPLYAMEPDGSRFPGRILTLPPAVQPGETLYSDLGYILLGHVLEVISGQGLDRLFHERVAAPAGLANLVFPGRAGIGSLAAPTEEGNRFEQDLAGERGAGYPYREGLIQGHVHDGNAWAMGGVAGHAGLFGTLDDVSALAREILAPARLPLGSRCRARLLSPVCPGGRTFGFQPAVMNRAASSVLPDQAPGHTGFTGTSVWLDPDQGRYWVLLSNRVHPVVAGSGFQDVRRRFHRLSAEPVPE